MVPQRVRVGLPSLPLFFLVGSSIDEGPLLVTGLGLWVTWKMFSFAFKRQVLRVMNTEGRLLVVDQYIVRRRQVEEWPITEASHIVAKGKSRPDQTNEGWFTLVGVNTEGGKWGPAWEHDLGYLLPRTKSGDVVEEASVAMGIVGNLGHHRDTHRDQTIRGNEGPAAEGGGSRPGPRGRRQESGSGL